MIQLRTNYVHTIKDRQINTIENITGTSAFFGTYHVGVGVVIVRISTAVGAVPGVRLGCDCEHGGSFLFSNSVAFGLRFVFCELWKRAGKHWLYFVGFPIPLFSDTSVKCRTTIFPYMADVLPTLLYSDPFRKCVRILHGGFDSRVLLHTVHGTSK